jgi:hypothetical protein
VRTWVGIADSGGARAALLPPAAAAAHRAHPRRQHRAGAAVCAGVPSAPWGGERTAPAVPLAHYTLRYAFSPLPAPQPPCPAPLPPSGGLRQRASVLAAPSRRRPTPPATVGDESVGRALGGRWVAPACRGAEIRMSVRGRCERRTGRRRSSRNWSARWLCWRSRTHPLALLGASLLPPSTTIHPPCAVSARAAA